jgi:hypothetical protein
VSSPAKRGSWKSTLLKLGFSIVLLIVLFELACQVMLWRMSKGWRAVRNDPRHCFDDSLDPILVYELKRNYENVAEGRRLKINQYGIRDDEDAIPTAPRKLAVLGDSVTFGSNHSQENTLPALLQQKLDPTRQQTRVLNFGVNGYGLREVVQFLKDKDKIYNVNEVLYVMNPNDFSWRDTIYEGADNNLYRTYRRPVLASPLFVGKAIYRYQKSQSFSTKNEVMVSVPWYRWMFNGSRDRGLEKLRELKEYCDAKQIKLMVLFLPAGCAYQGGKFELAGEYDDVYSYLKQLGVATIDTREFFAPHVKEWQDFTDHLTLEGNQALAAELAARLGVAATAPAMHP